MFELVGGEPVPAPGDAADGPATLMLRPESVQLRAAGAAAASTRRPGSWAGSRTWRSWAITRGSPSRRPGRSSSCGLTGRAVERERAIGLGEEVCVWWAQTTRHSSATEFDPAMQGAWNGLIRCAIQQSAVPQGDSRCRGGRGRRRLPRCLRASGASSAPSQRRPPRRPGRGQRRRRVAGRRDIDRRRTDRHVQLDDLGRPFVPGPARRHRRRQRSRRTARCSATTSTPIPSSSRSAASSTWSRATRCGCPITSSPG